MNNPTPKTLSQALFDGTLWMVAMSWLIRLLSIFSITILARLLETEDFGLVAITSAVVMLPVALLDMGLEQAIIQEPKPTRGLYNTAWTLRIIQMSVVAILLAVGAPWIADFYDDTRITDILYVLSVMIFIRGLENFWIVYYRKNMHFRQDFIYETLSKLMAVCFTIGLAWYFRSYWALVYGQVGVALIKLVFSSFYAPQLPALTLSHISSVWTFSQWSLVKGLAHYVIMQADKLILGRFSTVDTVGAYALGREIADLPVRDVSAPINRALGTGFSTLQDTPKRLADAVVRAANAVSSVTLPIGLGLACTAPQAIPVMLGDGWEEAILILQILACSSAFTGVAGLLSNTLVVTGYVRDAAILMWVRAIALFVLGGPAAMHAGAPGIAWAVLSAEVINGICVVLRFKSRVPDMRYRDFFRAFIPPGLSVGCMILGVFAIGAVIPVETTFLLLCAKAVVGGIVYILCLYGLWTIRGRPDGIEAMALRKLRSILKVSKAHWRIFN